MAAGAAVQRVGRLSHLRGTWATESDAQFGCCTYAMPEGVMHVSAVAPMSTTDVM